VSETQDTRVHRLAVLALHPVQYQSALYRALHRHPGVAETVYFLDDISFRNPHYVDEFRTAVLWDLPLTEGFEHRFLRNWSSRIDRTFIKRVNPALVAELRRDRFDAVLVTGYDSISALLGIALAKLRGLKVLFRTEADLNNPYSSAGRRLLKRALLGRLLGRCDAVLFSCERNRAYFRHYGVDDGRLFPILSSVDNDFFREQAARHPDQVQVRTRLGIPLDGALFLFVGRLTERKRPQDLLEAFGRHRERAAPSPSTLAFVGDGPLRPEMEARAAALGLKDRVIFAGFRNLSEVPPWYAAADVFVLPSEYDPTPKSLNEAMNFALPSIVSRGVGTAEDLVRSGREGLVFDVGDLPTLTTLIGRLAADHAQRKKMGDAAAQRVEAWSSEGNANSIVAALDMACAV
jgi:glycosyltransferase involved in cell wall biosynthesis